MAFSQQQKKEIEKIVKSEIKTFFDSSFVRKYEKTLVNNIKKEIKSGSLRGDVNDIVVKIMTEFYYFLWSKKNTWQSTLKNVK
jgi:anti-sigma28 factor (negative regulator of flagellin synthesis)